VQKGRQVQRELGQRKLTDEEEKARRELLFNQTNDKVRAAREAAARAGN
jgi:Arc/MetJ family transcription regulator